MLPFHCGDLIQPLQDENMVWVTMDNSYVEELAKKTGSYAAAATTILVQDVTWHTGMRRTKTSSGALWSVVRDPIKINVPPDNEACLWFFQVTPLCRTRDPRSTFWVLSHTSEFRSCLNLEEWQ